jgi:hypothetical protein
VIDNSTSPWETLERQQSAESLVGIARAGRLMLEHASGPLRVTISDVDECVLALVEMAFGKGRDIAFLYPAPAGGVAVLLAAELLLQRFVNGAWSQQAPSVGVLTADTVGAARTWDQLRIATVGARTRLSEVFPAFRCGPDGESPVGRRRVRGVVIGRRFDDWNVDMVVADYLAGPIVGEPSVPTVRVFADPLDPSLAQLAERGGLVWGSWPELRSRRPLEPGSPGRAAFSITSERLEALGAGVHTTLHVISAPAVENGILRLRDDLRTLSAYAGADPPRRLLHGLRVAWHHATTLSTLPCRPSSFDKFAGLPPAAARRTGSFEPEITAWARTLPEDLADIAGVIASDLGDLRAALEERPPFAEELRSAIQADIDTLIVVRTHTAARGFLAEMGADPNSGHVGRFAVCAIRRLYSQGTRDRAIVVGMPPRWDWHRLDSGLSRDLHVLVAGELDAQIGKAMVLNLARERRRWADEKAAGEGWSELTGRDFYIRARPKGDPEVTIVGARDVPVEVDPFAELEGIGIGGPLVVGDEGVEDAVAEETPDGNWVAEVEGFEVCTDAGAIVLAADKLVDVRVDDEILERRARDLEPGMYLLVGRREGRVGLLDAVGERLKSRRPDLVVANLLINDLQATVRRGFIEAGITRAELYRKLVRLGFDKTYFAARGYVDDSGPLAPRDLPDLRRLNDALELGYTDDRVRELFAAVQRRRTFRRAAGKALAAAARGSTSADVTRVDPATGLSVADLRDAVMETRVLEVKPCAELVPVSTLGRLEPRDGGRKGAP